MFLSDFNAGALMFWREFECFEMVFDLFAVFSTGQFDSITLQITRLQVIPEPTQQKTALKMTQFKL